jgi:hypothetical protein
MTTKTNENNRGSLMYYLRVLGHRQLPQEMLRETREAVSNGRSGFRSESFLGTITSCYPSHGGYLERIDNVDSYLPDNLAFPLEIVKKTTLRYCGPNGRVELKVTITNPYGKDSKEEATFYSVSNHGLAGQKVLLMGSLVRLGPLSC